MLKRSESGRVGGRLEILDSHPIQYRAPLFRALSRRLADGEVLYFEKEFRDSRWWMGEKKQNPRRDWGISLDTGFPNATIGLGLFGLFRFLLARWKRRRPDAILIFGYFLPENWLAAILAKWLNIRVLFVGDTFLLGSRRIRRLFKRGVLNIFFGLVDRVVSVSRKNRAYYKILGLPRRKVVPSRASVDLQFFCEGKRSRPRLRTDRAIPDSHYVLLYVGRMEPIKRPFDFLKIHRYCVDRGLPVSSVMIGEGALYEAVRDSIHEDESIRCLGFLDQAGVRDAFTLADLLIVPSARESWGMVVAEAFAAGLPALCTRNCGVSGDLVLHGKTGWLYPTGDIPRAYQFINTLIRNPDLQSQMRKEAKDRVVTQFSLDQYAEGIVRAYAEATSQTLQIARYETRDRA